MTQLKSATKLVLKGRGTLTVRPADHVATGGEGSLYRAKRTIIKLYTDRKKMLQERMPDKLAQLATLNHPFVMAPQGLVLTEKGSPVGFYTRYVDGEPLSRVFTNAYWTRSGFGYKDAATLVERMREAVQYAHGAQAVMVDPNELNWLVVRGKDGYEPRVIDVDSWAVDSWNGAVIMPSIRDWHAKEFNTETDWFAWGVVSFQVWSGIHPYKGTLPGFKNHDIAARMQANASVFRPDIRLNRAVRDFSKIPGQLLDWYQATFESGERSIPPSVFATGKAAVQPLRTLRMVTTAQGALVYRKLFSHTSDPVVRVHTAGVAECASGLLVDLATNRALGTVARGVGEVVETVDGFAVGYVDGAAVRIVCINRTTTKRVERTVPLNAHRVVASAGRLFAVTDNGLVEIVLQHLGTQVLATIGSTWGILPHATKWFDGVGVMDALGATHLVVTQGKGVSTVRVPELDNVRALAGTGQGRLAVILGIDHDGRYMRYTFAFDAFIRTYAVDQQEQDDPELNAVTLPKGVVARIEDDGELLVQVPSSGVVNRVADKDVTTDLRLARWGDKVVYLKDGAVWSLQMK